jgi:hypothetical protein
LSTQTISHLLLSHERLLPLLPKTELGQRWLCKMILVYTNLLVWASSLSSQAGPIREEKGLRVGPDNVQCMSRAWGEKIRPFGPDSRFRTHAIPSRSDCGGAVSQGSCGVQAAASRFFELDHSPKLKS